MYFWKVENNSTKVPKVFVADYYDDDNERDGGEDKRDITVVKTNVMVVKTNVMVVKTNVMG